MLVHKINLHIYYYYTKNFQIVKTVLQLKIIEFFQKTFAKPIDKYTKLVYNILQKGGKGMGKKKKSGNQEKTVKTLILITAIFNLIKSIIDLIQKFLE